MPFKVVSQEEVGDLSKVTGFLLLLFFLGIFFKLFRTEFFNLMVSPTVQQYDGGFLICSLLSHFLTTREESLGIM